MGQKHNGGTYVSNAVDVKRILDEFAAFKALHKYPKISMRMSMR